MIAVPTVAGLVLGGARIAASVQSALVFQRAEQRAVLASAVTQLAQRLETERDQTVYYIALGGSGRAGYLSNPAATSDGSRQYQVIRAFQRQTDQAIDRFRGLLVQFRDPYPASGQRKVAAALAQLNDLPYLRQAATKSLLYPLGVVQRYANLIDALLLIDDQTAQGTGDPVLSQAVGVLSLVSHMKEAASQQRAIFAAALLQGHLTPQEASALNSAQANQQSSQQAFNLFATAPQREQWNNTVAGSFTDLAASEEQQAATLQAHAGSLTGDPLTAEGFFDSMSNSIDNQVGSFERALAAELVTRSNSLRGSAVASAGLVGLAVALLLAIALTFTMVVGRSLSRPLRRLRLGALEVAGVRLPETVQQMGEGQAADVPLEVEPIDVVSTDEVGDVARAFDQVHREAVRLASTEAGLRGTVNAMFVNLSGRTQSMVERQIHLIDDLEQGEQEPESLANLFRIDHLATRMRRNSENLLVLAGHQVTQRWTQAVTLIDVARAAVSEIEQYERVKVDVKPGISVRGHAVTDVVHLLSELVENATSFSAGDTRVSVSAHPLTRGGTLIAISDQGVGMDAEEMAHANWRLDNSPVVDVAASRRMGLFVVARLADRHGIRVRLRAAPSGNGVTALVWLPDEVISHEARIPPSYPARSQAQGSPVEAGSPAASQPAVSRPDDWPAPGSLSSVAQPDGQPSPGVTATVDNRLPIFESVESDWFRRHRHVAAGAQTAGAPISWWSPADEGWRAAEVATAPVTSGMTMAGLPKRVPNANLVPGGVTAVGGLAQATPERSPSQARDRLASFQRGIQEGRAAAGGDDPAPELN